MLSLSQASRSYLSNVDRQQPQKNYRMGLKVLMSKVKMAALFSEKTSILLRKPCLWSKFGDFRSRNPFINEGFKLIQVIEIQDGCHIM